MLEGGTIGTSWKSSCNWLASRLGGRLFRGLGGRLLCGLGSRLLRGLGSRGTSWLGGGLLCGFDRRSGGGLLCGLGCWGIGV